MLLPLDGVFQRSIEQSYSNVNVGGIQREGKGEKVDEKKLVKHIIIILTGTSARVIEFVAPAMR